jgi:UDP-4-amino-4,6-dideoxy-N-acetyl-beta-L-altrosamine transaminase
MRREQVPFFVPWITREDRKAVSEALKSRWLTGGPKVASFEKMFAEYVGVKHAIAVNSCTAALHLAMQMLKMEAGDEVIVPVFTFAATANAPLFCGAKPVFADIDEKTFNISHEDILEKITPKTKAIIVVHYGGQACDMKEILEIAEDHKLPVVEDCAHSLGAEYRGKKTGNLGIMGCFSFYPTKIITTIEGGMLTTNDDTLASKSRLLREHGMSKTALDRESGASWYYDVTDLGYNYRLNEVQAALGISQLQRIEEGIKRRIGAAEYYTRKLKQALKGVVPPYEAPNRSHIFHLYAIRVQEAAAGITRDELFRKLAKNGIGLSVHYTPLHRFSFYRRLLNSKKFPVAEQVYKEILSLPLYPTLTKKNMDFVITKIRESVKSKKR